MGPGDFFGEAALRSGTLRNASILATSSVEVLALSAHNIKLARDQTPALAEQIDLAASERQARSARLDR
jgi:CRP-like cAMP-binding protein